MADTYSDLRRENRQLKQLLRRHGIEVPFSDRFDDEDFGEDEYDDSSEEEPSERFDEPSGSDYPDSLDYTRTAGRHGQHGNGHVQDVPGAMR
jgi:hypothetical protein